MWFRQIDALLLEKGYDVYGTDIDDFWVRGEKRLGQLPWEGKDLERFGKISFNPYRLPFEDNTFDFCYSHVVFEHVRNPQEAFQEIHRVLKPGGFTLHVFPSRNLPVEPHVFVPLATIFRSEAYLSLWAALGIRNSHQKGMGWRETANFNAKWLKENMNYMTARQMRLYAMETFGNVQFPHESYIQHSRTRIGKVGRKLRLPGFSGLMFTFHRRVLFMTKT